MNIRREITEHFREGIISGTYPAGMELPSTQEIARRFETQPTTVQRALKLLVEEGWIEREPRLGTRVREKRRELKSIALYANTDTGLMRPYSRYFITQLVRRLAEKGIAVRTVVEDAAGHGLQALRRLIQSDRIQAVFYLELSPPDAERLLSLPVAVLGLSSGQVTPRVGINERRMIPLVLPELQRRNCRRLAMLASFHPAAYLNDEVKRLRLLGIELDLRLLPGENFSGEGISDFIQLGYDQFKEMMKWPERPDSLLIYPDHLLSGVLAAAYELKVDLEREFKLIIGHRNRELPVLFPVKTLYLEITLNEMVERSVELLFNAYYHSGPQRFQVNYRLYDPYQLTRKETDR